MAFTLALYPPMNFLLPKPPILSKSDAGQSLCRTPPCPSIDPRDRYMQYICDLLNG
jgi:hypothetical protein